MQVRSARRAPSSAAEADLDEFRAGMHNNDRGFEKHLRSSAAEDGVGGGILRREFRHKYKPVLDLCICIRFNFVLGDKLLSTVYEYAVHKHKKKQRLL